MGCISSWFSAHSDCKGTDGEQDIIISVLVEGERRDTVPLQFISNSLLFVMFKFSHICRCQPTGGENSLSFKCSYRVILKKERERSGFFIKGLGRKERGEKGREGGKSRKKASWKERKWKEWKNRRQGSAASAVLIIKWCLAHQSKMYTLWYNCLLIIICKFTIAQYELSSEMHINIMSLSILWNEQKQICWLAFMVSLEIWERILVKFTHLGPAGPR